MQAIRIITVISFVIIAILCVFNILKPDFIFIPIYIYLAILVFNLKENQNNTLDLIFIKIALLAIILKELTLIILKQLALIK